VQPGIFNNVNHSEFLEPTSIKQCVSSVLLMETTGALYELE